MKKILFSALGILVVLVVVVAFIGQRSSLTPEQEAVAKNSISVMNEMSEVFDQMASNPKDLKTLQTRMLTLADAQEANAKKMEKFPAWVQKKLDEKYKNELVQAKARFDQASARFKGLVGKKN